MDLKFGQVGHITNKIAKYSFIIFASLVILQIIVPFLSTGWAWYLITQSLAMWIVFTIGTFIFYDTEDDELDRDDTKYFSFAVLAILVPYVSLAGALILLFAMIRAWLIGELNYDGDFERMKDCLFFKYWYPRNTSIDQEE